MNSCLRNPEIKAAVLKLLPLHVLFILLTGLFIRFEMAGLNRTITDQNTALVGYVLEADPGLGEHLVSFVTRKASAEDIVRGRKVLAQYGYDESLPPSSQPVLKGFYHGFIWRTQLWLLIYLLPLLLLVLYEYRSVFMKIRRVSHASEKVMEGDFSVILPEDREGDFSILGHHFNEMANRLRLHLERLKSDKVFLENVISDISHQLKTPLTSLMAMNELLLEGRVPAADQADFLQKSMSQLNRMEWLIANLLKMARLEAGAITFSKGPVPLINPVMTAINLLRTKADEKHQQICISSGSISGNVTSSSGFDGIGPSGSGFDGIGPSGSGFDASRPSGGAAASGEASACFTGDEDWTAEALANILKNCIEHTGENGKINIHLEETPILSRVIISDNGEGIDRKDLPHIFERFYKGAGTVKTESVGIGLALARLIIEEQGGSLTVSSEKGKGTTFTAVFIKGVL